MLDERVERASNGSRHRGVDLIERDARILDAIVQVVNERGFQGTSVVLVTARAKVSNNTFYECFDGLRSCFEAVLDFGLEVSSSLIARAFAQQDTWREGTRAALTALLVFFDSEPQLTKIWFGEAMTAGSWALERREGNISALESLIVSRWSPRDAPPIDPVLLRGVIASILGALTTHVVTRRTEPLITLLAALTSLATAPFLGPAAVRHDTQEAKQLSQALLAGNYPPPSPVARRWSWQFGCHASQPSGERSLAPAAPHLPSGHRARLCVLYLAEHPGASNRQIAAGIGVQHSGQVSTLLVRLTNEGWLDKGAGAPGRPNVWRLTVTGRRIAHLLERQQSIEQIRYSPRKS